jgi:HK97 family phage major capsid protein
MNTVEVREAAIGKLLAARSFLIEHPVPTKAAQAEFGDMYSAATAQLRQFADSVGKSVPQSRFGAGNVEPEQAMERIEELLAWAGHGSSAGTGPAAGVPFPGSGLVSGDRRAWNLGAGVVSALQQRGGFEAALVTSGNVPVAVPMRTEPVTDARAARFIADLIPEDDAPGGRYSYWKQTVRTNNAAVVAAGARKPTSIYTGVKVDGTVTTIAHLSEPVNRFDLSDAPMLQAFLTAELEYGARLAVDDEIVNGDGTGAHFDGILNQAASVSYIASLLATTRAGITALEQLDNAPTGFVFSPQTWADIEEEAQAQFASQPALSPLDRVARRLHGLPVVVSNAVADNTGILGDFRQAVLYRTGPVLVDWSDAIYRADLGDGDPGTDFERNMLTFRAELRARLALLRPAAFVQLDLNEPS